MNVKRILAMVLALCMILPLAACGGNEDTGKTDAPVKDTPTTVVTTVATQGSEQQPADPTQSTGEGEDTVTTTVTTVTNDKGEVVTTTTAKTVATSSSRTKKTTVTVGGGDGNVAGRDEITFKEGTTPLEKGLNFGGKTFSFAYYGSSWDEKNDNWFKEYQKLYNVKLDIRGIASTEYTAGLASAMASGKSYDMVVLYNFEYPQQITANTMLPLNDYITTADLWKEGSAKTGGLSEALMKGTSLGGNIYATAGNYLQAPTVLWYNKKMFADAGYDGADDPLALYKAGKWSWEKLYEMLLDIKDEDKGVWGINSLAPYYAHQFICSYDTDFTKWGSDGKLKQNLNDANLYAAFEMLQKFSYGQHKVADPNNPFEPGREQFLNGTIASVVAIAGHYGTWYDRMSEKNYTAFGSRDKQLSNLGMVPLPTKNGITVVWDWYGYGAGNGTNEDGIMCALAFAKYSSTVNHANVYDARMPADMKALCCSLADNNKLRAPLNGFSSAAGSVGKIGSGMTSAVALKGQNITVTLKGYENMLQTVVDAALKP